MPRTALAAVVAALIVLIGGAGPASAHNELLRTGPADGSTVATMPDRLTLTFNLPTLNIGTVIQVTGPDGDVATGKPTVTDDTVTQPLRPDAPAGAYRVVWRVTSADGHPISGQFAFRSRAGGSGSAAGATGPASTAGPATSAPATSATSAPAAVTGAADDGSGSPSPLIWVGLGLLLLIVLAGVLLLVRQRPVD